MSADQPFEVADLSDYIEEMKAWIAKFVEVDGAPIDTDAPSWAELFRDRTSIDLDALTAAETLICAEMEQMLRIAASGDLDWTDKAEGDA